MTSSPRPSSRPAVLLVTLVALLAGTAGAVIASVGSASALPSAISHTLEKPKGKGKGHKSSGPLDRRQVKKVVKKSMKKLAKSGTAANSTTLAGLPASSYQTTTYTIPLTAYTGSGTKQLDWNLPGIPAGHYIATMTLSASQDAEASQLYCTLYQDGVATDLLTAYGSELTYQSRNANGSYTASYVRTVNAQGVVAVTGALHAQCLALPSTSTQASRDTQRISSMPANASYSAPQITLTRIENPVGLAAAN
jgi:hypothetical protein